LEQFTFDEIAELYDRVRPRYPEELVDDLVSLSGIPEAGASSRLDAVPVR